MEDSTKARHIMIGGFLGAGKSTAILKLAKYLSDRGQRVGLITNDQGERLVDTAVVNAHGYAVEEIAGGCFCCRFNSLSEAADKLAKETRPDVFVAEPVGSCTDLVATVSYPLRRIFGQKFTIAPLSVMIDPVRALRIFKIESGPRFSEKVLYVYSKQLEEADVIIINKSDLVSQTRLEQLKQYLEQAYPKADLHICSARHGDGLATWFETLVSAEMQWRETMEVNYKTYGEGEALLGWLNATLRLSSKSLWDGNKALLKLAQQMQEALDENHAEIAHLKMTLSPEYNIHGELAVVNLVRNDHHPEIAQSLPDQLRSGQLIVNLRAEVEPEILRATVTALLESFHENPLGPNFELNHLECFKPSQPEPVYRDRIEALVAQA